MPEILDFKCRCCNRKIYYFDSNKNWKILDPLPFPVTVFWCHKHVELRHCLLFSTISFRLKLTFSCMMDLAKFPLDSQVCTMEVASCKCLSWVILMISWIAIGVTSIANICSVSVSKTIEELSLEWKTMNPVIMGKGLRMPQFEIVKIAASDCQESFQIGECRPLKPLPSVSFPWYYWYCQTSLTVSYTCHETFMGSKFSETLASWTPLQMFQ
jgi:hypothetical protein